MVQRSVTPVYMTPEALLPPDSTESLVPLTSVAIWFQRDVKTGTMIDTASINPFGISMTTPNMSIEYNDSGKWVLTSQPVDYTHGRFTKSLGHKVGQAVENGSIEGQTAENGSPEKATE